jgi:hypothetical protein
MTRRPTPEKGAAGDHDNNKGQEAAALVGGKWKRDGGGLESE